MWSSCSPTRRPRAQPSDYCLTNTNAGIAACDAALHGTRGDALAFTPEASANLWTTYEFPYGLTVGGGVRYVDASFVGRPDDAERILPNNDANMLPDYWVANAVVSYDIGENATLRLNIDNITDEFYALSTNWSVQRVDPRAATLVLVEPWRADVKAAHACRHPGCPHARRGRAREAIAGGGGVDGRARHRRPPGRPRQAQPPAASGQRHRARAGRDDPARTR